MRERVQPNHYPTKILRLSSDSDFITRTGRGAVKPRAGGRDGSEATVQQCSCSGGRWTHLDGRARPNSSGDPDPRPRPSPGSAADRSRVTWRALSGRERARGVPTMPPTTGDAPSYRNVAVELHAHEDVAVANIQLELYMEEEGRERWSGRCSV